MALRRFFNIAISSRAIAPGPCEITAPRCSSHADSSHLGRQVRPFINASSRDGLICNNHLQLRELPRVHMATKSSSGNERKDSTMNKDMAEVVGGVFRQGIGRMVREQLRTSPVVLFGRAGDKYTKMAKHALEDCGCTDYKYMDVNLDLVVKPILLKKLEKLTGKKATIPMAFINGSFVGGGSELVRMRDSGKLEEMLKEARRQTSQRQQSGSGK